MSDISKNVLEQIKEEGIKPRPRWQFVLLSLMLAIVLITTVVIGGIAMSLILLKLFNLDWDLVTMMGERGRPTVFDVLPMLWILLLGVVLMMSVWAFEKTDAGYKYHPILIVIGSIFISALLGTSLYIFRGADLFDRILQENVPTYGELEKNRALRFHLPEGGILPGRVIEISSPSTMQLQDLREQVWSVELSTGLLERKNLSNLPLDTMVVVIGERIDADSFLANDLRRKLDMPLKNQLKDRFKANFDKSVRKPPAPAY